MSNVEEDLQAELEEVKEGLKKVRENEIPHLHARISSLEKLAKKRFPSPVPLYKSMIIALSLLSFFCLFATITGFFSTILGSILFGGSLFTLLLFILSK